MNTNWKSKEEYLQFVQEWKSTYKALSAYIRGERRDRRIAVSLAATSGKSARFPGETVETLNARSAERAKVRLKIEKACGSFWDPSALATSLLVMRQEEKERAGAARSVALAQGTKVEV